MQEKSALQLTEEDFKRPPGKSIFEDISDLSSEIDNIWRTRQRERRQKKLEVASERRSGFIEARQAQTNTTYSIYIEENGKESIVKAEFSAKGRGDFLHLVFFRRQVKGGKVVIHGIPDYTLVKEVGYQYHERE